MVSHLRECGECTSQLISVAVAFGSLRAARRAEGLLASSAEGSRALDVGAAPEPPAQPPLQFKPVKRNPIPRIAAAAALIVVCALGVGLALSRTSAPPVSALATLHHMDAPASASGRVTVRSMSHARQMDVVTAGLPAAPANHYYEVWLLQPATNKMMPVGLLSPTGDGTFSVSSRIMAQYSAIDISLQANNGDPRHSAYSVLRGIVVTAD